MANEISEKAYVSPKAKIGNNCKIFPFAYIEDDVEIGDNCIIFPFVSILNGTKMGSGNKIHQGAVLGALPQDFDFCGEKTELVVGNNNIIRENVVINRATHAGGQTVIGDDNFLMEEPIFLMILKLVTSAFWAMVPRLLDLVKFTMVLSFLLLLSKMLILVLVN